MRGTLEGDRTRSLTFRQLIDEHDLRWAKRHLGIRVNTGRPPTLNELREMVTTSGLSMIRLEARTN